MVVKGPSVTVSHASKRKTFTCQQAFDGTVSQEGVWNYLSPTVESFIQGHNVSIIVYGRSGAGKSYTLGTSKPQAPDSIGLIPRASRGLFKRLQQGKSISPTPSLSKATRTVSLGARPLPKADANRKLASLIPRFPTTRIGRPSHHYRHHSMTSALINPWVVTVSYIEIFNEQLRDLLKPASGPSSNLTITEDAKGNTEVTGVCEITVENDEQLQRLLDRGSAVRQANSHAIFTFRLTQTQPKHESDIVTTMTSKFNFVDLAATEQQITSASVTGLASLSKVISHLYNQPLPPVSYRESKLTRLLYDSLGGRAVTHLVACITGDPQHVSETINTLTYAGRARVPEGSAKEDLLATIQQLQSEVNALRGDLSTSPLQPTSRRQSFITSSPISSDFDLSRELTEGTELSIEASKERVDRSQEFHDAVENVIADYEKTIGSLQSSLLESRGIYKETQSLLDERTLELQDCQTSYLEVVEMAESIEQKLNGVLREQRSERQLFEEQLKYALSNNNTDRAASPAFSSPLANTHRHSMSPTSSDVDSRRQSRTSTAPSVDLPLDAELYLIREQLKSCQQELKGLRVEHKNHGSEAQFLTARYNQSRREAETLKAENAALRVQLAQLELKTPPQN